MAVGGDVESVVWLLLMGRVGVSPNNHDNMPV